MSTHSTPTVGTSTVSVRNGSKYGVPVVMQAGAGESVGRAFPKVGMKTNLGTIVGLNDTDEFIVLSNGQRVLAEHIYVLKTDAASAGWPNNSGDIQAPDHQSTNRIFRPR